MTAVSDTEPMFFDGPGCRLFGTYHAAAAHTDKALLVCPPIGLEGLWAHRVLRVLAIQAARAGMPAFRIDYPGCGDSAGDDDDITIPNCIAAAEAAMQYLRDARGHRNISIVGLRLGAYIAAQVTPPHGMSTGKRLLWEPPLDGQALVRSLRGQLPSFLAKAMGTEPVLEDSGPGFEAVGMRVNAELEEALSRISPDSYSHLAPAQTALIGTEELAGVLAGLAADHPLRKMADISHPGSAWRLEAMHVRISIPSALVSSAVSWVSRDAQ